MTKPDPNSPDHESSDSDPSDTDSSDTPSNRANAVWLDLVARLEGKDPSGVPVFPEGAGGAGGAGGAAGAAAARPFSDFDPLGLSVAAPIELSARERHSGTPDTANGADGGAIDGAGDSARPGYPAGPRDYEADDDDPFAPDRFVPEEPPSLAGADPMTVLAWLGAVGGPIALILFTMFWRSAPLLAILGLVAAFAASVVFLIMKLPGEKNDHDDGARV